MFFKITYWLTNVHFRNKWVTEDFFLGTINEPFRVELELFVLDMKVSYIAIDDIMLSNSSYIPGMTFMFLYLFLQNSLNNPQII